MHSCDKFIVPGSIQKNKNFNEPKGIKVYIYENEGEIPHCHVVDYENIRETSIRLDKCEYFQHQNELWKFDEETKKLFAEFMESQIVQGKSTFQRWLFCVLSWNGANRSNLINNTVEIPNYRNLP